MPHEDTAPQERRLDALRPDPLPCRAEGTRLDREGSRLSSFDRWLLADFGLVMLLWVLFAFGLAPAWVDRIYHGESALSRYLEGRDVHPLDF